jgi:hypothetical protein
MTTLSQTPGDLDIEVGMGDDLSLLLDFDIVLTSYTFAGAVVKLDKETAISVANTDLSAGQITISLTDTQITALGTGHYRWYLTWTLSGTSRRVLAGDFTVKEVA